MKVCPVCQTKSFDDMETCYGCMHHFNNEGSAESESVTKELEEISPAEPPQRIEIPLVKNSAPLHAEEARFQLVVSLQPC
ncbi:MAG: hypothetical protein IJ113_09470 [Eggerthellaceae bacterium]|nr:hypothetical protein [Eggerthellaceae bacterium]